MKVLWFSNREFVPLDSGFSGTWLQPLADTLLNQGKLELANVAYGNPGNIIKKDCGGIQQWIIPYTKPNNNGMPANKIVREVINIHDSFSPDIVHFWGVEYFWGLLRARNYVRSRALLDIQGLTHEIARNYSGGLSILEQIKCIGPRELILGSTMFQDQRKIYRWGPYEKEMIRNHKFINTQSPWIEAKVKSLNPECEIFHNELALRDPFYKAKPWNTKPTQDIWIFCSASYPAAFKGVHIALRAISILRREYPSIQLRIAGLKQGKSIRKYGYISWLQSEARKIGIQENVMWLGTLNASEIISELSRCSVALVPSFTESYCVALAEAMILGVPTVTSFTGGTSYLAKDEESALFFPPGDVEMCAYQIRRLLKNHELAIRISQISRNIGLDRNGLQKIANQAMDNYSKVFKYG